MCLGYGYHSYGHQYCKEVSQETCYNVPKVMPVDVPVMVTYPEPMKAWSQKIGEKVSIDSSRAEKLNMMTIIMHVMVLPWTAG